MECVEVEMEEPVCKKRKMKQVLLEEETSRIDKFDDVLNAMKLTNEGILAVLSDEVILECPKIEVYVGKVLDKSKIGSTVIKLKEILPIPDLQHLKRVKDSRIILRSTVVTKEELRTDLEKKGFEWEFYLDDEISVTSVASKPPMTKWQYELAHKLWPCNFHANKYLERIVSSNFFSTDEIFKHRLYMAISYDVGLIIANLKINKLESTTRDSTDSLKELEKVRGVIVVDPKINSIVSIGYDRRTINPCQHQIMVAIDNVARTQNGGSWNFEDDLPHTKDVAEHIDNDKLDCRGVSPFFRQILKSKYPEVTFGARTYKAKGESDPNDPNGDCGPYLCTDYYVYTTNEPCIMCAMALVHCRAKRVFFGLANLSQGALVTKCKLHTLTALNHRYEVFTNFFTNE